MMEERPDWRHAGARMKTMQHGECHFSGLKCVQWKTSNLWLIRSAVRTSFRHYNNITLSCQIRTCIYGQTLPLNENNTALTPYCGERNVICCRCICFLVEQGEKLLSNQYRQ